MQVRDLRLALFSGNYNYVRDGANQALNRLVGYLLRKGAQVRVYSPTVDTPAFPPTGDLVSIPSMPIPFRPEYRFPLALTGRPRRDLAAFAPNVVQIASPDRVARQAAAWGRANGVPVVASVHTRFETYFRYYGLGVLEPVVEGWLRRLYQACDAIVAPSQSMVDVLQAQRMNDSIGIWSRGVDRTIFSPAQRSMDWRRSIGIGDDERVVGFVGRLVLEKGLDEFSAVTARLRDDGIAHRVLVVGEGPARDAFTAKLPGAVFTGFQSGAALGRAVASMDMLFNPSTTETFGNVTLEAMASGLPVVAASATGSTSLVTDGVTGRLIAPGDEAGYAAALSALIRDPALARAWGDAAAREADRYDWDAINGALADIFVRVATARRTGRGGVAAHGGRDAPARTLSGH